ncbi:MAG: HDOD domain-containing protein [Dissulfurispiraceae bacterium]
MTTNASEIKETLIARMNQHGDFPAMTQTITLLNKLKSSGEMSSEDLSNVILKDYALTLKILRLINSVGFVQFGEVTTISRAIMLLGFENIRNIALTLLLYEHIGGSSGKKVKELLMRSICSGLLAQNIAEETKFVNVEEAFICSLFHTFGKIMVAFYMPEKAEEIMKLCTEKGSTEEIAAMSVLGSSYETLGMEIAEKWNFPKKIIVTMKKIRPSDIRPGSSEIERFCLISNISNEVTEIMASPSEVIEKEDQVRKLVSQYKAHFEVMETKVSDILSNTASAMAEYADMFSLKTTELPFFRTLTQWAVATTDELPSETQPAETAGISTIEGILEADSEKTPDTIFSKGVMEINTAILNNYQLNDVIKIALETIYRGIKFSGNSKVLFLLRDAKTAFMKIKFGFGADLTELRKWFEFSLDKTQDIFNMALSKPTDLVIRDISAAGIRAHLPPWYLTRLPDKVFVIILPIVINGKPLGLFYIEGEISAFGRITSEDLKYLTMLRDQTVLAIKQKHSF